MSTLELDDFYSELTVRNTGFVSTGTQNALRSARILVAGCGSTGGAAVEPLVRLGATHLVLADNGRFELNNLNRQHADHIDIDRYKAVVAAERARAINPFVDVLVERAGVTRDTVTGLVAGTDIVVDGVDVTDAAGWRAKLMLHEEAAAKMVPVVTGYDMAGLQYIRFYDYRTPRARAFDGRITRADLDDKTTWALLARAVPVRRVPVEMLREARSHLGEPGYSVPQLVYTSLLFGALTARIVSEVVSGAPVRREVVVDVHRAVRTRRGRAVSAARHAVELSAAAATIVKLRRDGRRVDMADRTEQP